MTASNASGFADSLAEDKNARPADKKKLPRRSTFSTFKWNLFATALVISTVLLCIASWIETREFRHSLAELEKSKISNAAAWRALTDDTNEDLDRSSSCRRMVSLNEAYVIADPKGGRLCLLRALPQTKTAVGAFAIASPAFQWLAVYPNDEEVRAAALAAIENGWDDLRNKRVWYFNLVEKVDTAHNRSRVMTTLLGYRQVGLVFNNDIRMLEEAELNIRFTEIRKKMKARNRNLSAGIEFN